MPKDLSQQVILITGASSGIGAALARMLAERFPDIRLVLAARSVDWLDKVAADCRVAGAQVLVVPTDMSCPEQVEALAQQAIATFEGVDILVNNAGYGQMGPIELIPPEKVREQFDTNVLGAIALCRCLTPSMRDRGGGRIINISSLGGRLAFPFGGLYSASKFALEGFSDALRMELSPFNIRVSVVEPGPVRTNFFDVANQKVKQSVPNPDRTPYRAAFKRLEGLDRQVDRQAWSAERVAGVIVRVMRAARPRSRYVAATGGNILLFLMRKVLPIWAVDAFWKRFYGIDLVERDWHDDSK
jgi:NAD(P)-dependent dehydrogenase (short-subunit alcohol dehydrogenase family)